MLEKDKIGIILKSYQVNKETAEVELTGFAGYSELCPSRALNFETAISNTKIRKKCHQHSQLYEIILHYCNLTIIKMGYLYE